ncbi:hypothetical protein BCI9360_02971 [Bacillus sp. CECT 9360]|nr:hypothetical protein BCI9360_02971 [Bacillus sp. CECT 9360]
MVNPIIKKRLGYLLLPILLKPIIENIKPKRFMYQAVFILSTSFLFYNNLKHSDLLNHGMFIFESTGGMTFGFVYILGFTSLLTYCAYNLCMGIEKEVVGNFF